MGKSAKTVLAVAVAVAIPFAAPAIAGAIATSASLTAASFGLSATAGATLGSAAVGAGLGAVGAKLTGGDVGRGALMGGIGGGIGGFTSAQAAQAAASPYALDSSGVQLGTSGAAGGPSVASADPYALSGSGVRLGAQGTSAGATGATTAAASPYSFTGADVATGFGNVGSSSVAAAGAVPGATPTSAPTPTFTEALAGIPGEIAGRFSDPKVLADMTLRAAGSLLSGQMAGDGLSPEEQELLQAQMTDLQNLREQDEELFKTRVQEAMGLLGEARYFDPAQFGFQAQAAVQRAGAQQMREAERAAALTPGRGQMSASDRRRAGLDIAARGQTAYAQGAESGQKQRLATYQAGLTALPNTGPTQGLTYSKNLMDMYGEADKRKRQVQGDIGDFFGSLTGTKKAASIG